MNENGNEKKKSSGCLIAALILIGIIIVIAIGVQLAGNKAGRNLQSSEYSWNCTEYDPPFDVVFIDGEADVYGVYVVKPFGTQFNILNRDFSL